MFELPLSEATMSEVLARVAYRWIVYRYNRGYYAKMDPLTILSDIASELQWYKLSVLYCWALAYKRQWAPIFGMSQIREQFILDARRGYSWRRVAFPQYKRQRSDPRVTNRGVARDDSPGGK